MKRLRRLSLGLVLLIAGAGPAAAENVLRFTGIDGGAAIMDPHSSAWPERKQAATKQVYEALLDVDSNLAIVPQLAVAWKLAGPDALGFRAAPERDGFMTARRSPPRTSCSASSAPAPQTSDFRSYVQGIAAVEAIDDHTVRITTTEPDPSLWLKLAEIAIMSKAWAQEHGVIEPADYKKAHEENYASRHANGTGPFMVEAFEPRGDYVLVRNPAWWGTAEYPHNIDRVVHTRKEADAEKLAALLEGEIDLLQTPPYSALDQIRGTPGLKLAHRPKLLTRCSSASTRAARSCARPTSRAATRSRTSGCARRWPTRSTSSRSFVDLMGETVRPGRDDGRPGRQRLCRRNWTSRPSHDPERPEPCSPRPATRMASA